MNEQERCKECGGEMVVRLAGTPKAFMGCSQFPNCKNTTKITQVVPPKNGYQKDYPKETLHVASAEDCVKPKKSYKLTDGNIRIGALQCAIEFKKDVESEKDLMTLTKAFEEYIRNGK